MSKLNASDLLIKARISLQKQNPFFSYLAMHLKFKEDKEKARGAIGVDIQGNVYYDKDWIETLSDKLVITAIVHEVSHIMFEHLKRREGREGLLFNIATDTVTNNFLKNNGFELIEGGIIPHNNRVDIFGMEIDNIDKKIAEQVYDELHKQLKGKKQPQYTFDNHIMSSEKGEGKGKGQGDGKSNADGENGNKQEEESPESGKNMADFSENQEIPNWKRILTEALAFSKQRGMSPKGMDRYIQEILFPRQNWRELLYRYIVSEIPSDYSYARPSKKFYATGIYMPHLKRENVDIVVVIDTSGSIEKDTLRDFLSEVVGVTKAFDNVRITLLACDTKIHAEYEIGNGFDLKEINLKGYGGTDCTCVREWIRENKPMTRLWVYLTDGYTEFTGENPYKAIWVITREGNTDVAEITENVEIVRM
jgi:predicted metal-dependent peptidase